MVGSGYDDKDPWASLMIPKTCDGKKAVGGGTKMTYRYYLQDMAFAVALQAPADEAEGVLAALQAPVWDLYLGRKTAYPRSLLAKGCSSLPMTRWPQPGIWLTTKNALPPLPFARVSTRAKWLA